MKTVPLHGKHGSGTFAIVDEADYELVAWIAWHVDPNGYVRCNRIVDGGIRRAVLMHREVMGLGYGDPEKVDHRNGDTRDNRRANLRICTVAQNNQTVRARGGTSQFRGVHWCAKDKRWRAGFGDVHLGSFRTELEAARAAQQYRLEHMPFTVEPVLL